MGKKPNWRMNEAQVGEEVKITVALSLKKLSLNDDQKELEFPSSLTSEERKYIHFVSQQMGFKSKSRGKGSSRYLTVYKKEGSTIMSSEAVLGLSEATRTTALALLHRCPVTNKERQDLLPATERDRLMNPELRDLSVLRSLGRLTPGPPQVPPPPGPSDLSVDARKLPIWAMRDQLLPAIHHHQVILVCGETGSGKTTQVPQMLLQESSSHGKPCRIFCTQPRRISALTIAERVAAERGEKVGYTVGYQIRLESKLSPKTLLTFCTNGVLLRTLMGGDSSLASVTHILVDEIHERDRFTDFLLIVLKDCLPKFRHLKLILMSAALDVNLYAKYFNNCPVIDIPGKCYPVKEYFLEDVLKLTNYMTPSMQRAQKELQQRQSGQKMATAWTQQLNQQHSSASNVLNNHTPQSFPPAITGKLNVKGPVGANSRSKTNNSGAGNETDASLRQEMDRCIQEAFLTGSEESFSQMMYLILSENVSPDYQHSETWASPLMVAAGRGAVDIMEQLLAMGASLQLTAANNWTAATWAKSTGQQEALDLLQAYSACEGVDYAQPEEDVNIKGDGVKGDSMSLEDKKLLEAYHHSVPDDLTDTDLVFTLCHHIHTAQPPGAILIFLPGYDDIVTLRERILAEEKKFLPGGKYIIFCLHSSMQSSDQKRVFRPAPTGVRKIILSTNIAESSVTINDVVYVIDSGKVKEISYDAIAGVSCLKAVWICQASSQQRKGRAGRCQPGICYHLFSRTRFASLRPYQTPEILRTPLQELCLHTKLLAPANMPIADFLARAPEAPAFMVVRNAVQLLKSMDALDGWEDVTELGHHLLDLPLPPRLAKMVLTATVLKCLDPVLTIAACLAYKDPFTLPKHPSEKRNANNIRKKFAANTFSDHMVLLRTFQAWQKACGESWERGWCERNFVSGATMEMIHGMRAQVLAQLRGAGFVRARGPGDIRDVNSNSDNWAVVKAALVSGMYPNLIRVDRDQQVLRTQKESKVRLHPSSALLDATGRSSCPTGKQHKTLVNNLPSDWLVYDEMVRIGIVAHVRTVTLVTPLSVLLFAGPMRLPLDALSEPSNSKEGSGDGSSDSESEERPAGLNCLVRVDGWVQFLGDQHAAHLSLQLRHKLHALILRRLRAPNKPLTQADEDVVRTVAAVLGQEEQALGLVQPSGVGQRPRPIYLHSHQHGYDRDDEDSPSDRFNSDKKSSWSSSVSDDSQSSRSSSRRTSGAATPTLTPTTPPASLATSNPFTPSTLKQVTSTSGANSSGNNKSLLSWQQTCIRMLGVGKGNCVHSTSQDICISSNSSTSSPKSSVTSTKTSSSGMSGTPGIPKEAAETSSSPTSPASPGNRNKEGVPLGAVGGNSKMRYFVIKASMYKQLEASYHTGLWAFTHNTEKKLLNAAQNGTVVLVFTLHRSGQFNGYAKFSNDKTEEKCADITNVGPTLGPLYKIEWIKKWNISFHQSKHLYNPFCDNMQVHLSRDGQEVEAVVGEQLVRLWDKGSTTSSGGSSFKGPNPYMMGTGNNSGGGAPMMHDNSGPPPPPGPPRHPLHPPHMGPLHGGPPFHRSFRNYGNGYGYGGGGGGGGGSGGNGSGGGGGGGGGGGSGGGGSGGSSGGTGYGRGGYRGGYRR
ncbi:3'-5' RNA helicase YTHDC2-like isoform X3 [Oratosquilla oratoria]|uniref:3'-5' RNA helicase YTHDC2-like isoform X3 n=1 Tax=Oratosquilla oratoria TaxID=337810 RepID=UPI003F76C640